MQRTIQQITQQLVDRLPDNDQYYRLGELRSWDFPSFIVRRIKIELERNLAESMIIPKTDWANTKSDAVLDAWQNFVDAIRAEARLPASYGKTVIETAVADVVEMLVQPRKNIPSVIFGTEDELTADEIQDRLKAVVVYPHFSRLIPRYMQKKELEKLSKERCAKIISTADQKLTKRYSPLNWAQMLEPLFKLVGGEIDTNLLRLFFEDKNLPRIARKLDLMNDTLSRAQLIEVLSSPDLLDFEGYEDEQSSLFMNQPSETGRQKGSTSITEEGEEESGIEEESDESTETVEIETDIDLRKGNAGEESQSEEAESLNSNFIQQDELSSETDESEDDEGSLNTVFQDLDDKREEVEEESVSEETTEIADEDSGDEESNGEKKQEKDSEEKLTDQESEEHRHQKNGQEKASETKEETPIWMRYMSEEEIEQYEKEQEAEKEAEDEGFIEEPIIDLTKEEASDEEIKILRELLKSDRELFVEKIFRGSDRAYDEAVEDIAAYDSWGDVSKFIEKDIFKRNLVDMYSEAAVDFTDRLQTYFLEKQNQNK